MADVVQKLVSGFTGNLDPVEIGDLQGDLGRRVMELQGIMAEERRERMVSFVRQTDPAPLARTVLRLRHDLVILRRTSVPLPGAIAERLDPLLRRAGETASAFLRGCANALGQGRAPPSLGSVEAALEAFEFEVASLRSEGLTRALSTGEVERLFAVGFGLEQLRQNLSDLARCVREFAAGQETP